MERCEVAIVGGGPVGLLLACLLTQRGVDCRVFERQLTQRRHSRAIGIHPPGLACLDMLGLASELTARGICVRSARAFMGEHSLGSISFSSLRGRFRFVLSVPEFETERVLENTLAALKPGALERGAEVRSLWQDARGVRLSVNARERERVVAARWVVGCDGRRSTVRRALGIGMRGAPHRARFVMADLPDDTGFGCDAAVFLSREGLVESFPLPHKLRRWVVRLQPDEVSHEDTGRMCETIERRTGWRPSANSASMISSFTAEHYLANEFVSGRVVLAGDAAHIVSPIGGQGMNLGFLDVCDLAARLFPHAGSGHAESREISLSQYACARRHAARRAIRRASFYMAVGGGERFAVERAALVRVLLFRRLAPRAARLFTMSGLA